MMVCQGMSVEMVLVSRCSDATCKDGLASLLQIPWETYSGIRMRLASARYSYDIVRCFHENNLFIETQTFI